MGRRRKQEEEHENHERWLVSYADFITLLFAFFVVMYALSSINEGKYKVLSEFLGQRLQEFHGARWGAADRRHAGGAHCAAQANRESGCGAGKQGERGCPRGAAGKCAMSRVTSCARCSP